MEFYFDAKHTHKKVMHMLRQTSVPDLYAQRTHLVLTCTLRVRISPDTYALHVLKGPFQISYLHSVHVFVPEAYAQCTHQLLTCMLKASISS